MAWQEFKRGKTKKIDIQNFNLKLEDSLFDFYEQLKNKTYQHFHYTSFYIRDPKPRHIHKACVRDRVLHHALFRILYSIFDPSFIFDSYSCRISKGTHRAINRLEQFARKVSKNKTRNCFVLKCDVKRFFDSVDHNILIRLIQKRINDNNALWLIKEIIDSFQMAEGKGLPLGNITSQLFANIYLNELDKFVKHRLRIKYYIRYCDDFVILSNDREYLEKLVPKINTFLKEKLNLSFNSDKIIIRKYLRGIDFLGYVSFPYYRALRTKTKRRMFRKIEQKIKRLKQDKISEESFNQTIQSYLGLLKHCNSYKLKRKIIYLLK